MLGDGARTKLRGRRIGFVFQSFHLLAHRSVVENVMLAELYGGRSRRGRLERARVALERVGLGHRAAFPPDRLSGGERQRAAIARAMLGGPSLLLCDEPTGNLDSRNTEGVLALFDELRDQGLTIVVITHEAEVSERATRRVRIVGRHPGRAHPRPARSRRSDGDPLAAGAGVAGRPVRRGGRLRAHRQRDHAQGDRRRFGRFRGPAVTPAPCADRRGPECRGQVRRAARPVPGVRSRYRIGGGRARGHPRVSRSRACSAGRTSRRCRR
jgi:hypothetical protein